MNKQTTTKVTCPICKGAKRDGFNWCFRCNGRGSISSRLLAKCLEAQQAVRATYRAVAQP